MPRVSSINRKSRISKGSKLSRMSSTHRKLSARRKKHKPDVSVTTVGGIMYFRPNKKNMKTCHIFYLLSPSHVIHVSVAVMGDIAKVCTKDEVVAMKAVKLERNTVWVAFSITHQISPPENFLEVSRWNQHKIDFTLSKNPGDIFPKIKREDVYYSLPQQEGLSATEDDIKFEQLQIVAEQNQKYVEEDAESRPKSSLRASMLSKEAYIATKLAALPSPAHTDSVKRKIFDSVPIQNLATEANTGDVRERSLNEEEVGEESGKRKRKRKGGKKITKSPTEKRDNKNLLLTLTGSKILYDKRTWSGGRLHVDSNVQMVHIWLTSTNALNEELRTELIPFGIYIKNLMHFPKLGSSSSFSNMKLKYSLGDLIKNIIVTPQKEHDSDKIVIDDVKMFFLGDVPLLKIIENLQMNKLIVEIYGSKQEDAEQPKILYSDYDLEMLAKRLIHRPPIIDLKRSRAKKKEGKKHKTNMSGAGKSHKKHLAGAADELTDLSKLQLLGYAEVNCSTLADGGFRIDREASIRQHNAQEEISVCRIIQHFDLFNAHENVHKERKGVVENGQFVQKQSYLQVCLQVSGLPPVSSPSRKELYQDLFKRIVIVFKESSIILPILRRIFKLNSSVLGYKHLEVPWVPLWFPRKIDEDEMSVTDEHPCMLSGFAIDFSDKSVLMVEGLNDYTFPEAMKDLFSLPQAYGRVMYDELLIFTERLYQEFFPIGGIFCTTIKSTIDDIVNNKKTFLRGNVPIPALRAAYNIYRLMNCPSIQVAAMERLFLKSQDLVSFNIEFG